MAGERPDVAIRPGFSATAVAFEVTVTNPGSFSLWSMTLTPRPVPPSCPVDREQHSIPLLRPRRSRRVVFRTRPPLGQQVIALDLVVEWEDDEGANRGRMEESSRPVDLALPDMGPPRGSLDRWRSALSGGPAVEVRLRHPEGPGEMLDLLEGAMADAPGTVDVQREEGPRGTMGRAWVRAEGPRGRRAGLMVDVTPDPRKGGCRLLVTASASSEELLARFYHACLPALSEVAPGIEDLAPHSLLDAD